MPNILSFWILASDNEILISKEISRRLPTNHNIAENDNLELLNKVNIVYSKDKIKLKNHNSKGNAKPKHAKSKSPSITQKSNHTCDDNQDEINGKTNIFHQNGDDLNFNKIALSDKKQNQSVALTFTLDENVV